MTDPDPKKLDLRALEQRHVAREVPLPPELQALLAADPRKAAAAILRAVAKRSEAAHRESERLYQLSRYEDTLWTAGITRIAGVDEAGMSPLAGPVVAAAVIIPIKFRLSGVDDSKKLTPEKRANLAAAIKRECIAWAVGKATPAEIDEINIYRAGLLAMRRAVEALKPAPEHLLIDARPLKEIPLPQQAIIRGDAQCISIAAASIIAKTTRDAWMTELDREYPGYGFAKHKGYPVKEHLDALRVLGACGIHRRSFGPVKEALGLVVKQGELFG